MPEKTVQVVRTARDTGQRLAEAEPISFGEAEWPFSAAAVFVDPTKRFQTIEGFGGAFTEASAANWQKMSPEQQAEVLRAYFDPKTGHGYSLCRLHMNSCDFSLSNYACCETPGDTELASFSLDRERQALLPMMKQALAAAGEPFKLFISPWSPPAWMKTTNRMNEGGKLKPEYRRTWARYYCRFVQGLRKEGIDVWGLTVQNEPEATQTWDSCIYTPAEERDFVRDHLGPTLQQEGLENLKLMIWDHNRDRAVHRAKAIYDDPEAARYVWGMGFHWYAQSCFDNIRLVHDTWPDKALLFTEGCQGGAPYVGEWKSGERYGQSIIRDLNRWTVGWVDWNMILDEEGGPRHVGGACSAPIVLDRRNKQVWYQSSYYYLGHFARFIRPGSQRVLCASTHDALEVTAARNRDGTVAVVILNRTEKPLEFALDCGDQRALSVSPQRSISTYTFRE